MNYQLLVISSSVGTYLGASVGRYFACCGRTKVRPYIQCDMMVARQDAVPTSAISTYSYRNQHLITL